MAFEQRGVFAREGRLRDGADGGAQAKRKEIRPEGERGAVSGERRAANGERQTIQPVVVMVKRKGGREIGQGRSEVYMSTTVKEVQVYTEIIILRRTDYLR